MAQYINSRRDFLKIAGKASAFLAVGFSSAGKLLAAPSILKGLEEGGAGETELNNFILITPDNRITIYNPRPEMGQGTFQSMPALIAEELEVPFSMIDVRITDGHKRFGPQGVGGSASVRESWLPLRKIGAAAKEMLLKAAANRWDCAPSDCVVADAKITHRSSGKSLTYGELVADAAKLDVPQEPKLKDPKDFKILGKSVQRPDIPSKVNGKATFGIDVVVPGMLYATIQRCPTIHGKLVKFNEADVAKLPGVKHVMKTERKMFHKTVDAVAVLATSYWSAVKARQALDIEWDNTGFDQVSTDKYFEETRKKAASSEGNSYPDATGDVKKGFAGATKIVEAVYETPFASHAPMEPMTATAWVQGNKVEVWAPVQDSAGSIGPIAEYLKIPAENVKINPMQMGGSFGRKGYIDFVFEVVHLSKLANAPVKLIWSREDDMTNGPYRPGMINAVKGGLDASGNIVAWEHKIAGASILGQVFGGDVDTKADEWAGETADQATSAYKIPNRRLAHINSPTDIPIVWWRSVYSSTNSFAQESFMDEMAHAAGKDPMEFRKSMLRHEPRWTKLLNFLEEKSNYSAEKKAGKFIGVAIANSFGSTAAYTVTVSKKGNGVKIDKVVGVLDCGQIVNPDNLKAQTEGNVVMALSAAIKPGITVANGEVQETNFHQYPILRLNETPHIEIHIIDNLEAPGGGGEPGLPPFTPALFNAIFLATGKRIRRLPVDLDNLEG